MFTILVLLKIVSWKTINLEELLQEKRKGIIAIATKHGANNIRVFGSAAREEANERR